jgi:hypothetical protein
VSIPSDHKGEKDVIDAEFTGADVDARFSEETPDLRLAFKQEPRRTWPMVAWFVIFWGGIGLGVYYLVMHTVPHREPEPSKPGWERLARCSFLTSFDGNKDLSLWDGGRAELFDNTNKDKDALQGEWRFDEATSLFAVIFDGISKSYAVVEPGQGPICMLLKSDLQAADLKESWFSQSSDEGPRSLRSRAIPPLGP